MICAANRQTASDKTSSEGRSDDRWPRLIKVGVHQVKIYRDTLPSGAVSYRVEDRSGPKRQLKRCETVEKAEQIARDIGRRLRNPAQLASMVSSTQAAEYLTLRRLAGHFDLTVLVTGASEALKHLGVDDPSVLVEVAKEHSRRSAKIVQQCDFNAAAAEFLKVKATENLRPRSIEDLRFHLGRLGEAFQGPVSQVTIPTLSAWLESLAVGPASKRKKLTIYGQFFSWCGQRGYCDPNTNPAAAIKKPKVRNDREPETYSPGQLRQVLEQAEPRYRNVLALMAFAGLRPMEAQLLNWEQINWLGGYIHVSPRGAKTRTARRVPVLSPLREWLGKAPSRGPVWPLSDKGINRARAALTRLLPFPWITDGLRHSWISNRLVLVQNEHQVALEAGNSPEIIFKHYRAIKSRDEAEAWFAVRPHAAAETLCDTTEGTV